MSLVSEDGRDGLQGPHRHLLLGVGEQHHCGQALATWCRTVTEKGRSQVMVGLVNRWFTGFIGVQG